MIDILNMESFKFALDNTVDAVVITDIRSIIIYINPAFTQITGFTESDSLGRKPSILRSRHTTQATYQQMWNTILSGGWWRGEIINVRKDGQEWYSFLSISQIKDEKGEPIAYVGISRDITEMKQLQMQLKDASLEAIYMLSIACEAKDEVTGSHVRRVESFSRAIAEKLGLSPARAEEIGYSSMMHDVGKLHVPDAILRKPGPLTREEWVEMARHPINGYNILRDKPFYETAREIAQNHHEKWDGSGYPDGKKGEEIPLSARIVTVADVFDALTTTRPYKKSWSMEDALAELINQKGKAFDPKVVDAFVDLYRTGVIQEIKRAFP